MSDDTDATYYCPRGCQQCGQDVVEALGLECGACGSIMTRDSRQYDAFHDALEARLIAEFEAQCEEEQKPQ